MTTTYYIKRDGSDDFVTQSIVEMREHVLTDDDNRLHFEDGNLFWHKAGDQFPEKNGRNIGSGEDRDAALLDVSDYYIDEATERGNMSVHDDAEFEQFPEKLIEFAFEHSLCSYGGVNAGLNFLADTWEGAEGMSVDVEEDDDDRTTTTIEGEGWTVIIEEFADGGRDHKVARFDGDWRKADAWMRQHELSEWFGALRELQTAFASDYADYAEMEDA